MYGDSLFAEVLPVFRVGLGLLLINPIPGGDRKGELDVKCVRYIEPLQK